MHKDPITTLYVADRFIMWSAYDGTSFLSCQVRSFLSEICQSCGAMGGTGQYTGANNWIWCHGCMNVFWEYFLSVFLGLLWKTHFHLHDLRVRSDGSKLVPTPLWLETGRVLSRCECSLSLTGYISIASQVAPHDCSLSDTDNTSFSCMRRSASIFGMDNSRDEDVAVCILATTHSRTKTHSSFPLTPT